ncbi:MAG TPA: HipA family kinase [Dongiaceae bacterium]|nr:HipA family kinase [Dongiaceae bacterium]
MTIIIEEIIDRSTQGRTEPFVCRGSDGALYYVKGRFAGRESQIKEFICGGLAVAFGLPIPAFSIVDIPQQLINFGGRSDLADLGGGPAFGSRHCGPSTEVTYSQLKLVESSIGKDLLVFDWWIRNEDRNLTAEGGNPNLLWDQSQNKIVIIDHNLAFDADFDCHRFAETHVFNNLIPQVFDDLLERARYTSQLDKAFTVFDECCDNLPEEWLDEAPGWFKIKDIKEILNRYKSDAFWKVDP